MYEEYGSEIPLSDLAGDGGFVPVSTSLENSPLPT